MDPTIAELMLQLEALNHRILVLEAEARRPKDIRCTKLEIVDAAGDVVATVFQNGTIVGRALAIEGMANGNSLRFDSVFGELEIRRGNQPTVVLNQNGLGTIRLDCTFAGYQSFVEITPNPDGGRIHMGDKNAKTVFDANTSSAGAILDLRSHDPEIGEVHLGVDGGGNGQLNIRDSTGVLRTTLP